MWPCTITCGTSDAYVNLYWGKGITGYEAKIFGAHFQRKS